MLLRTATMTTTTHKVLLSIYAMHGTHHIYIYSISMQGAREFGNSQNYADLWIWVAFIVDVLRVYILYVACVADLIASRDARL